MKKPKTPALSWKARLRGKIYCAPACGMGCTKKAHDRAVLGAKKLVRGLGPGWKPRVWENLGWHYAATNQTGRWKIHTGSSSGSFTAFLGESDVGGRWARSGSTPAKAIHAVLQVALQERATLALLLEGGEELLRSVRARERKKVT